MYIAPCQKTNKNNQPNRVKEQIPQPQLPLLSKSHGTPTALNDQIGI